MAKTKTALPMPKFHKRERNFTLRIVAGILGSVVRLFFGLRVHELDRLPKTGSYILVSNHCTNVDALAVAYFVYFKTKRAPHFMAKEGLFRLPVIGKILLSAGQIPVYRSSGNRNDEPLRVAYEYLKRGHTISIFPEGTLTREPNMWPMKGRSGAVRLALESGVPVYPIAHWGSHHILPRYSNKFRPGFWKKVDILVGNEIDLARFRHPNLTPAEVTDATDVVMGHITKLVEQLRGEKAPAERWDPVKQGQSKHGNFVKAGKGGGSTSIEGEK